MASSGLVILAVLAGCGSRADGWAEAIDWAAVFELPPAAIAEGPVARPPAAEVRAVETAGLLPPGSRIVPAGRVEGAIAFAYRSPEIPAAVVRWYRGSLGVRLLSEMDEGGELVLTGTTGQPAGDFSVRLAADTGGTTAMVLVTPRR